MVVTTCIDVDIENEKMMISLLKYKCGKQFTTNLEGMVNDVLLSKALNSKFQGTVYFMLEYSYSVLLAFVNRSTSNKKRTADGIIYRY